MKRFLTLFVCCLLFIAMAVPAFAANVDCIPYYDSLIEGVDKPYFLYFDDDFTGCYFIASNEPLIVTSEDGLFYVDIDTALLDVYCLGSGGWTPSYQPFIHVVNDECFYYSNYALYDSQGKLFHEADFVVNSDSSPLEFLDSNVLSGVLDYVMGLLPVLLIIIVGYIGLRKAINCLFGLIRSS